MITTVAPNLADLVALDSALERKYADKLVVNSDFDRTLVSFQANKTESDSRWFKYREGFRQP